MNQGFDVIASCMILGHHLRSQGYPLGASPTQRVHRHYRTSEAKELSALAVSAADLISLIFGVLKPMPLLHRPMHNPCSAECITKIFGLENVP